MKTWDPPSVAYKPRDIVEVVGWTAFFLGLFLGFVFAMLIYEPHVPSCHEDEAWLVATKDCVPVDDLQEAAVDLYVEANMQHARNYIGE